MAVDLYQCCFCLNTVTHPVVMCYQTHVGCFNCVCKHICQSEKTECPMCRESLHLRFDRLVTESAAVMHRPKRRKGNPGEDAYAVFLRLLDLKNKERYRIFTRTFKRFAVASDTPEAVIQLSEDIENILKARKSGHRLLEQKLYDPAFHSHISI